MNLWVGPLLVSMTALVLNFSARPPSDPHPPDPHRQPHPKAAPAFGMAPAQFWRSAFGSAPWYPLAGDADGDGRADLLALQTGDSTLAFCRTSRLGKPLPDNTARAASGPGLVAAAAGSFVRKGAADVVTIFADGAIKLTWGMEPGTNVYVHADPAGTIPQEIVPQAPTRTAVADFDGDGKLDVMALDKNGSLLLLRNDGVGHFIPVPIKTKVPGARQFAGGTLAGEKSARCLWLDEAGNLCAALVIRNDLGTSKIMGKGSPNDHLAAGRFRGGKAADVILGQRLYPGGDPKAAVVLKDLPPLAVAKDDGIWDVADIDGNGKDDLIRHHEGHERWGAQDVYVHFAYDDSEPAKGFLSTANDGLPDFWKLGMAKPGGLDLAALGCKVGHRDVIVEIERFENADIADIRNHMNRAAQYFASIPLVNPDGTTGIALHVVYREPWAQKDHDAIMGHFDDYFPRMDRRGVVHTMFAEANGPLVSAINGDRGHFNGHWAEFTHEFGHQLDLVHDAFYPSASPGWGRDVGCVLFPSLMSYTYSYGVDDNGDRIGYSDGARAGFVVDERHLSEKVPLPMDKMHFVGAGPYRFRLQASPDGKSTLVDWNWNGVFGEENVSADLDYSHGVDFGPSYTIAKTKFAPVLVAHGGSRPRPLLVYGTKGSGLAMRTWIGLNRDKDGGTWSEEVGDENAGVTGDPSAAYLSDGSTWVAYPTAKGTALRKVTLDAKGKPILGRADVLSGTLAAQPTLAALDGRLVLLLWRNKTSPVGMRLLRPGAEGLTLGGERPTDLLSDVPVGATAGRAGADASSLWVGRIQPDGLEHGGQTEVVRLEVGPSGGTRVAYRSWVSGSYARHRMTLLWREEGPKMPEGRVFVISGGTQPGGKAGTDQYITMNIPYPDFMDGWLYRRYQQPGFTSLSAPGACFFEGSILYAIRRYDGDAGRDDNLNVAFYGDGAAPGPMGDFDELGHIRDFGLSRSIRGLTRETGLFEERARANGLATP